MIKALHERTEEVKVRRSQLLSREEDRCVNIPGEVVFEFPLDRWAHRREGWRFRWKKA